MSEHRTPTWRLTLSWTALLAAGLALALLYARVLPRGAQGASPHWMVRE